MTYLGFIDHGLTLGIIAARFFTCWAVIKRGFYESWKAFSYFLFIMAAQSVILLAIYELGSRKAYSISFYVAGFAEAVLLSLVVLEILVKILEPFEALPGRRVASFCFWAVFAIFVAVAASVSQPSRHDMFFTLPLMIQRTIFLADAALLWVLLFQAKSLGITWRSSVVEIAWGFVLFLTIQAMVRFLAVIYTNITFIRIVSEIGQAALLCSICSWIWTMYHRAPIVTTPSAETLTQMRAFNPHTLVPKEKIFAAVGVKINKFEAEPGFDQPTEIHSK